jgi:protein SCO1/2
MAMGVLMRNWQRRAGLSNGLSFALLAVVLLAGFVLGCDAGEGDGGPGVYSARGTVEDVDQEGRQVLIDHGDVDGLMPAMTMNFVVPDDDVLARLATGQIIEFELRFTGRSYEVEGFEVVGEAPHEAGWRRLGDALVRTSPAPDFDLIDQAGRPVTLASLAGKVLVVDFIYTECPGPCPIQTSNQVALQKRIPKELSQYIQFVSISLDPEVDRPEVLKAYGTSRGASLSNWSFLTGERGPVADLVLKWGVGSVRKEDGTIDHTLLTFLVKDGRVMERYSMQNGTDDSLFGDLVTLAEERARESTQEVLPDGARS